MRPPAPASRIALVAALVALGCAHTRLQTAQTGHDRELVGVVRVLGADPLPQVALVPNDERDHIWRLEGPATAQLHRVSGLVVSVQGHARTPAVFVVKRFRVLQLEGRPVLDGVVTRDATGRIQLSPATPRNGGPLPLPAPPFDALVGARIWVLPDATGGVEAYGIVNGGR
ncbi:MAG TPA: hypothetical protein VF178_08885 [Gemmatimonadaceae bacterium]